MNNKKKDFQPIQSDIHRIVDLPLEFVSEYLRELDPNIYTISIEQQGSDEATFLIKTKRLSDLVVVQAQGSLKRWNGTFTRLDADIQVIESNLSNPLFFPAIVLVSGIILPLIIAFGFPDFSPIASFFAVLSGLALLLLGIPAIISFDHTKMAFDLKKAKNPQVYRALIKDLENDLSKRLKEKATTLEFDGSELSLEMLLSDEKHKHFRLSADGELDTP